MTASAIVALLVEVSWRSVLVAALVGCVLLLWRVKGGAVRHAAWAAVMVAMLLMPGLMAVVPEWQMPITIRGFTAGVVNSPLEEIEVAAGGDPVDADARGSSVSSNPSDLTNPGPRPVVRTVNDPANTPTRFAWQDIAVMIWLSGVVVSVAVMLMGWRLARRLVTSARTSEIDPRVLESTAVSAPCAVGVWRAHVLVPRTWRMWSRAGRDAVLTHELAHVQRRDLLVAFAARINRAIFWFNPVAWWLERRIAAAAEQACDEVVLSSGQDPHRYASLLVEMAGALRSGGGRVAWQSIGMADGGDLESRVDRVLSGEVPQLSRWRVAGVLLMSTAALVLAVACQQAPAPLMPNPEVTAEIEAYQVREAKWKADKALTLDQATALVKTFAETNDLSVAQSLLTFYMDRGQALMGWNEMVAARRPLLLTLIERHPESGVSRWPLEPRFDPAGWAAAKDLWLAHVGKADVSATVLGNAAAFFESPEPERAEQLLLRAAAIDPDGPQPRVASGVYRPAWMRRLGVLYAGMIVGATNNDGNTGSALAQRARQTLEDSTDPRLLAAVGQTLLSTQRPVPGVKDVSQALRSDLIALGREYIQRAVAIDPSMKATAAHLARFDEQRKVGQLVASLDAQLGPNLRDATPEKVAALPADVRLDLIPRLAQLAYSTSLCSDCFHGDPAGPERKRAETRAYAQAAAALAADASADPRATRLRLTAALAFGALAMHDGDRRTAVRHLGEATAIARSVGAGYEVINYQHLVHALLDAGERETVAAFYDAVALHSDPDLSKSLAKAASDIRRGVMPENYQRMRGRRVTAN